MTLLPPNSTATERAVEAATERTSALDVPVDRLWNPETCPAALLPWLAWALSVDEWSADWSEERKRAVIAASIGVHRRKGTVGSVKAAIRAAGYGDATVVERFGLQLYNAAVPRNGSSTRAPQDHWAEYRIVLSRPISIEQAEAVRRILADIAPVRCSLKALTYLRALSLYNATVPRDGSYSRGVA